MSDTPELFARAREILAANGLVANEIDCSGDLAMCGTSKRPGGTDGRYKLHLDFPPTLWLCNYHEGGDGQTIPLWKDGELSGLTPAEREALKERIRQEKEAGAARLAEARRQTADRAKRYMAAPDAEADNSYLAGKKLEPLGDLREAANGALVVPMLDAGGNLMNAQRIFPDGKKRFLKGGQIAGCYFPIPAKGGGKAGPLLIGEGLATVLACCHATGHAGLVAFSAGNLEAVSTLAREKYPAREILLCADYDDSTHGFPDAGGIGLFKAKEAAQAIGAKLAVSPPIDGGKGDFADHWLRGDRLRIRQVIEDALAEDALTMPEKLPAGFSIRAKAKKPGLWHTEFKEEGEPIETWLGAPLHVLGATRDENGNAWGLLLEWDDLDGQTHRWAMPKAMLASKDNSAVLARLADEGWSFATGQRPRNLLYRFLGEYQTARRARCVPQTGWFRGAYVFPDSTLQNKVGQVGNVSNDAGLMTSDLQNQKSDKSDVQPAPDEEIVLQNPQAHNPFLTGGTLEGWKNTIGAWALGNSRLMLAICASFAGALLEPAGQESGGINWLGPSSIGKTTALTVAGSIWGKGAAAGGYVLNWRATANGLEGLAALHCDAALCLDELGQAPAQAIVEASYMLANGLGKSRARQDGTARTIRSWRTMVLSTGEQSLADKVAEAGRRLQAGQLVRLIDVPADAGKGLGIFEELHGHESAQAFALALKGAACVNYGHPARAFIARLQEQGLAAVNELQSFLGNGLPLLCREAAAEQVQRVGRRFLLCVAAGEMAAEWGLLPWAKGDALGAVKACFEAWLAERGGTGNAEEKAILEQVGFYIEANGNCYFHDVDNPPEIGSKRAGFRRTVDEGSQYIILPEIFRQEVCKGLNPRRAAEVLLKHGLLIPGDGKNLMRKPPVNLPGFGRKRCYVLLFRGGGNGDVAE